jgi:hypothetical protein
MYFTQDHQLAIALIKNDYINYRLVSGLSAMGIDASIYYLRLHEQICKLMGLQPSEMMFDRYFRLMKQTVHIDLSSEEALQEVAEGLYKEVLNVGLGFELGML